MSNLNSTFIASIIQVFLCASHLIMYPGEEKIIWTCGASNTHRSYRVSQLDINAPYFNLVVYDGPVFDDRKYLETVKIDVEQVGHRHLTGKGRTSAGTTVTIRAFGGTVAFNVNDDKFGFASGRCNRNVELN